MKYTDNNKPIMCMMTNSTCYKSTKEMTIKGVLWHSTGANNPNLKRYVQPSKDDPNYDKLITQIGKNTYGNDWNHISKQAGLNAWIGKLADGSVASVQTMPWKYRPWGCGSGSKGSCNNGWIQFEICEDNLTDKTYFNKIYQEACELTAYLCKTYGLDPKGQTLNGTVKTPVILCHKDSYTLGLGSNHTDILHWFEKYGKTMDDVRNDVYNLIHPVATKIEVAAAANTSVKTTAAKPAYEDGDIIKLKSNAKYTSGKTIPKYIFKSTLYFRGYRNNDIVFSTKKTGAVTGVVASSYVEKVVFQPYTVKINTAVLNVRAGAGTKYMIKGTVKRNNIYTIVEEYNGWGKLKSGIGWIKLSYTKKV